MRRRLRTRIAGGLLAAWLAGCQTGPGGADPAADAQIYEELADPQGSAAYEQAMAALARGDRAAALVGLRTTVERCPDHVRAHRLYQDIARDLGGEAAVAMLAYYRQLQDRGNRNGPSPVPAYVRARLADTSYAQGNALQQLLASHPAFAWGHLSFGRVSRRQGRMLQALDSFGAAIRYDAGLREARLERGQVLAELGRFEEAAVDYEGYVAAAPDDDAAVRAYLQLLIYRLRRVDRAFELLQPRLAAAPGDAELRMHHAAAAWLAGRHREALDGYVAILATEPRNARAALNVGLLYFEVIPRDDAERRRYWPQARAAFRWFLGCDDAQDGHEQFERAIGVPYRLARIAEVLGPESVDPDGPAPPLDALRWRDS